jgi:hypothetical protein
LLAYNQMTTGNPLQSAYVLWWPYDRIGFGEGIGVDGHHTLREGIRFARINFRWLRMYLYGWPLELSLVPAGIASAVAVARMAFRGGRWVRARRRDDARPAVPWSDRNMPSCEALDLLLGGIVVGIMVVHLAYATPGFMYGPRYYFETIGALVLLSARGLFHIAAFLAMLLRLMAPAVPHPRLASFGVVLVVAVALFTHGYSHFAATEFRKFTGWNNVSADNVREVKSAGLSDAVVFVQREKWTDYAPFFAEHGPRLDSDVVYAIDLGPSRNRDLMRQYPERQFYRFANDRLARISR